MKMKKMLLLLIGPFLWSAHTYAIDCPAAKVSRLQVQSTKILIRLEGQGWHSLGSHTNSSGNANPMVSSIFAAALAAQMAGREVVLRYPAGYDCLATDYNVPAEMLRTL